MERTQEKGFTLIEMIVVIGIVVLIPTIVVVNFSHIRLQFSLSRATHQFAADVYAAQDMAASAVPYQDSLGQQQTPAGYGVYVNNARLGSKKYLVYADVAPGNQQYDSFDHVVSITDLTESEPGITIQMQPHTAGSGVSINFQAQTREAMITVARQQQPSTEIVFVTESSSPKKSSVVVNNIGLIDIK